MSESEPIALVWEQGASNAWYLVPANWREDDPELGWGAKPPIVPFAIVGGGGGLGSGPPHYEVRFPRDRALIGKRFDWRPTTLRAAQQYAEEQLGVRRGEP